MSTKCDCLMEGCRQRAPEECRYCGFRPIVHAQRVDAIHKRGLRQGKGTKTQYLPVKRQKKEG